MNKKYVISMLLVQLMTTCYNTHCMKPLKTNTNICQPSKLERGFYWDAKTEDLAADTVANWLQKKYRIYWNWRSLNVLPKIEKLLKHGYTKEAKETINGVDKDGSTPLYCACLRNNLEIVKLLLDNGATETINKVDINGWTPLYWACDNNNLDIVKLLLPHCTPETINKVNKYDKTPLFVACDNNNLETVKLLLDNGAKETINIADKTLGRTPLYWACWKNNLDLVKLLLDNGAKETINIADKTLGLTTLYMACDNNNLDLVELLLLNGASATQKELNRGNQVIKSYLKAVQKYNNPETIKINFIMSLQEEDKALFNFLIKYCFAKSLESILKNGATLSSTAFYRIYTEPKINLEDIFGIQQKGPCLNYIKQVLNAKGSEFYFAKKHKFKIEDFIENMIRLKMPQNSNNKKIKTDIRIICQK